MLRTVSDGIAYVAGLFVESATTEREAEAEAKEEMVRSMSDDNDYWQRLSSGVLSEEVPQEQVAAVAPEFQAYAVHWAKYGRSLNVIGNFADHAKATSARFQRKQDAKARRAAVAAQRAALAATYGQRAGPPAAQSAAPRAPVDLYEPITAALAVDPHQVLAILQTLDTKMGSIEDYCSDIPSITKAETDAVVAAYDYMLAKFMEPRLKQRYGYNTNDHRQPKLRFGENVPSYFANVIDQSIHRRKVLSMAGLRNLVMYGPIIYSQLAQRLFSGDLDTYRDDEGLKLMRTVTGNVVDLDTTVLRCTDKATVNAINMSNKHKKLPTFNSLEEFAQSDQAQEIAINCSLPLLEDFAKMMKIAADPKRLRERHIDKESVKKPVPVAQSNTDRGKHPIWHYVNAGQNSFHANVPTMEDVNGALLKAPVQCALHWMMIHTLYDGPALEERIDKFFEDCIVDSCFNMKWKSIELFGLAMRHEGTVVDVLQRAQQQHQHLFTAQLFDEDDESHTKEKAVMWSVVSGRVGRDKDGKLRPITEADVALWVDDPAVVI